MPRIPRPAAVVLMFLVFAGAASAAALASTAPSPQDASARKARYTAYARASADWAWDHYDQTIERWKKSFDPNNIFGYRAPGGLLEMAAIYAHFAEKEGKGAYIDRAKNVLLTYADFRAEYPEKARLGRPDYAEGVPPLPDFFTVMRYIRAYDTLHRLKKLSPDEAAVCEKTIIESVNYMVRTQEWGAMNRAILRAETLAWAVRALPGHKDAAIWDMQRKALGEDNWGNWEIEDATIYNGVWLYSLLGYADALGKTAELLRTPEMVYYGRYFLNLMSPAGMIPDFGDARWESNWPHFLVFFEAASASARDPELAWAAETLAGKFIDFSKPESVGLGYMLLDAVRFGAGTVPSSVPSALSQEVMDDIVGKKIVFRDGWQPDSLYLLLNYRDEGDGGLNFRDYLRDTIPVEEEKMTHGHADENSIPLLMAGGSLLLHDAGYRDYMPSGPFGAYRQDYFHNRLCVRPEKIFFGQKAGEPRYSTNEAVPAQGLLDFLRNAGSYRKVRTQKVDFLHLPDFDYSRTRMIDDNWGFAWDRVVAYVKEAGAFVVFDILKSNREEYFTAANLWHTQNIYAQGEHWFDTGYEFLTAEGSAVRMPFPKGTRLLVAFADTDYKFQGTEPQKRHYQDERTVYQVTAQHFELGQTIGFATVLWPHPAGSDPAGLAGRVKLLPVENSGSGLAVEIEAGGKRFVVAAKADLRMDMSRDNKRPKYTYAAGRVRYGDFETNGDFLFAALSGGRLDYTAVNLTRIFHRGRLLKEAHPWMSGLAFDGTPNSSEQGKLRYWRDSVDFK
ncbi:MAG: hypothetical protein JW843_08600 [Candidatus Aminicenantes bacterium]|nr:hypothetical protein [Candidatus Aminicenantes bacterium]